MARAVLLFAALVFRQAMPGYHYEFPRDHFNHPEFQTEWWYYTGNLQTRDSHRYGFELVFFRKAQNRAGTNPSAWRADDIYMAHLALTDIDGRKFRYAQRLNRAGPGIAGAGLAQARIWNGNWEVRWDPHTDLQTLSTVAEGIRFQLRLTPRKPPVIHGEQGVSQTGNAPGQASCYVSFPQLAVEGSLNGMSVSGQAWMDHEWFSNLLEPEQVGWDWFSVQLENNTEFMLFRMRRVDGTVDPHSSGTYIAPDGHATFLRRDQFTLDPVDYWTSPRTHTRYPVKWRITIPSLKVSLECDAAMPDQELAVDSDGPIHYWEGAVRYSGSSRGVGYLEMTGYDKAVRM